MNIVNRNPEELTVGWTTGKFPKRIPPGIDGLAATFFVKASYRIGLEGVLEPLVDGPLQPNGDVPYEGADDLRLASDFVPFKPKGEFLLTGSAVPPGGWKGTGYQALVRVGSLERQIAVVGPRVWEWSLLGEKPGAAGPAGKVALRYGNAWGGSAYALNPLGVGQSGGALPTLEDPRSPALHRGWRGAPAACAPIPRAWEQRACRSGDFGGTWTAEGWPWLPADFDYAYFNAAPPSQWLPGYWRGDETVLLEHLVDGAARLETRLPGLRARMFVTREEEPQRHEEVPMVLDTVAICTDAMHLSMVWRGRCPVRTIKMHGLRDIAVFLEPLGLDSPIGDIGCPTDAVGFEGGGEADPVAAPAPKPAAVLVMEAGLEMLKKKTEAYQQLALHAEELAALRAGPAPAAREARFPFAVPPGVDHSMAAEAAGSMSAGSRAPAAVAPAAPVPDPAEDVAQRSAAARKEVSELIERVIGKRPQREDFLRDGRPVVELLRAGRLSGVDLSDLDFSGLDLSGIDFSGVRLAGSLFVGADLSSSLFVGADLSGADLTGAKAVGAGFSDADFTGAALREVDWSRAILNGAQFAGTDLRSSCFANVVAPGVDFSSANLAGARLLQAVLHCADFSGADCRGTVFEECQAAAVDFRRASAADSRFVRCGLENLRGGEGADFGGSHFEDCAANNSNWEGSMLMRGHFVRCHLRDTRWCDMVAGGIHFANSDLSGAVFDDAELVQSAFRHCNLLRASLERCRMEAARLEGCNLYDCGLWETDLRKADWTGCFVKRTRLDPAL